MPLPLKTGAGAMPGLPNARHLTYPPYGQAENPDIQSEPVAPVEGIAAVDLRPAGDARTLLAKQHRGAHDDSHHNRDDVLMISSGACSSAGAVITMSNRRLLKWHLSPPA